MIRALGGGVLVILAVVAAGFVAQRIFGSDSEGHPMTEAREAVESLSFPASVGKASDHVLVGSLTGRNQIVHIVIADFPGEPKVVAGGRGWSPAPGPAGPLWLWDDARSGRGPQTKVAREARADLVSELEGALCRKATGEPCTPDPRAGGPRILGS
jgi:hypothetical protein